MGSTGLVQATVLASGLWHDARHLPREPAAADIDRVSHVATRAFQRVIEYFGTAPFRHYTVHQELLTPVSPRHEYGMSMEHLDSSTYYLAASSGLTGTSAPADEKRVLYNFAHHMAHAWVPKRAYGEGYFPFQWELAPLLDSIWFAEGFGQYAAIMALAAERPDPAAYRRQMLTRRFQSNISPAPAFLKRLPLAELSRVASTRYSEDFRTGRLVFARRADGRSDRRAHSGGIEGHEELARRATVPGRLEPAGTTRVQDRRARRTHSAGHRRRHAGR